MLIVIVSLAGGYFYYSNNAGLNETPATDVVVDDLSGFASLSLDFSIFDSEKFKLLEIYGEFPVDPGVTSKRNPFAPF